MSDARKRAAAWAPAVGAAPSPPVADPSEILTIVGEAVYEWTIADDRIAWGPNVGAVFGFAVPDVAETGRGYAALVDPESLTSRHDAVLNSAATDDGGGVAYEIQYSLLPDSPGTVRRLIVEDSGRWYADGGDRPVRARGVVRIINERHEREQRLAFLSRYDELTGYFNRQYLLTTLGEALAEAKRGRTAIAFVIVAIDNFRAINEAYGFETADQVFAAAARRIRGQLREGDAIGRYSGNKLGIMLMNCAEAEMHAAAERFQAAVRNGVIATRTSSVAVTVSIGGVELPRHGRTVNEALARAQESLHQARTRGYGRFVAYAPSPTQQARRRSNAALSSEMVTAIDNGRLKLFFQPVVDVETRKVAFHEGLVRLERGSGSVAPATDFIELCEQLGLIRLIDTFALDRTLTVLEATPAARVSINVSAETVGDAVWLSRLAEAITQRPELAARLIVEITESAVIRNLDEAAHFIATIHDLGCLAAIDDFGAGFSSFRNLRSLGIDIVKIDGAFIENLPRSPDDQAFVRALGELARAFDIDVVAEWVQDEETAALLKDFGVHMLQGTLAGAAVPDLPPPGVAPPGWSRRAG